MISRAWSHHCRSFLRAPAFSYTAHSIVAFLLHFSSVHTASLPIIDYIPFNGEPVTQLRLHYLEPVVDLFVLIEAAHTFTGYRKTHYFLDVHEEWYQFLREKNKLLIIKLDEFPAMDEYEANEVNALFPDLPIEKKEFWFREYYQRQYGVQKITKYIDEGHLVRSVYDDAADAVEVDEEDFFDIRSQTTSQRSFILLACDADEIPRAQVVKTLSERYDELNKAPLALEMLFFTYSFKWLKKEEWAKAFAIGDGALRATRQTTHGDRIMTAVNLSKLRMEKHATIPKAGWHCNNFMSSHQIYAKLKSFSHAQDKELVNEQTTNITWIRHCMQTGYDVFARDFEWEKTIIYDGYLGYPVCEHCHVRIYPPTLNEEAMEHSASAFD